MKRFAAIALAGLLIGGLLGPVGAEAKGKKSGPQTVGVDSASDWGASVDPELQPVGDAMGQELVEARINMADMNTVEFIIVVNSLPPGGGVPEASRYTWDFNVDGEFTEIDGKFTNYSRGACDPTSGQCPPPRDPGTQPFMIRGNCSAADGTNVTLCEEIGIVQATFDAASATITVPVPLDMINAKPGSKIEPAANLFGGSVSAAPSAFFTSSAMPLDTLVVLDTFVVASGKKGKKKK